MTRSSDDLLPLSGLQHFKFCRRQWALIHIEQQWAENLYTVDGHLLHKRAHDKELTESRGDTIITRGMAVFSHTLGLSGECDVLEFHRSADGVPLRGHEGHWLPYPVEYKRGAPNGHGADELQLCAQAMCLEEMLCCEIAEGSLYYGQTRRRKVVRLSAEMRQEVRSLSSEMHELYRRGRTPSVKPSRKCSACSLRELCLPHLLHSKSVAAYLRDAMEDTP